MSTPNPRRRVNRLLYFSALVLILIVFSATLLIYLPRWLQERFPTPTPVVLVAGEPRTVLNPAQGYRGTLVQVQGSGWPAGQTVQITLNDAAGPSAVLATATVDNAGRFTVGFLYPSDPRWSQPGPHTISSAVANTATRAESLFTVLPPTPPVTATTGISATATQLGSPTAAPVDTPTPVIPTAVSTLTPLPTVVVIQNWRGDYWNNADLTGTPALIRDDANVDFVWGFDSPAATIERDNFSARWVRTVELPTGRYRFFLEIDDGARLYLDDRLIIDDWRDGAQRTLNSEQTLSAGSHQVRLEYYERSGLALARLWWERGEEIRNWRASYFANADLQGAPALVRDDANIDFAWGLAAPAPGLPADLFSVRWERAISFAAGRYRFAATVDDGVRVWLDDELLIDEWHDSGATTYAREATLANRTYRLRVEYYENNLGAQARFGWEPVAEATATPTASITPSATRTPLPVVSLSPTWTPIGPTAPPASTSTATWTPLATATPTTAATPTWTPISTATATPTATATFTATPTATATSTATATQTLTATATLTATPPLSGTLTPTVTLTPTLTPTATLTLTTTPALTATVTVTATPAVTGTVLSVVDGTAQVWRIQAGGEPAAHTERYTTLALLPLLTPSRWHTGRRRSKTQPTRTGRRK